MSGYVLSTDAEIDLNQIWEYIAADSFDAADRWIGKLFDAFESLGRTLGWAIDARISRLIRFCSSRSALISSSIAPSGMPSRSWPSRGAHVTYHPLCAGAFSEIALENSFIGRPNGPWWPQGRIHIPLPASISSRINPLPLRLARKFLDKRLS